MPRPRVLLTASTFPRWPQDTDPAFVLQLGEALSRHFDVTVLAPHCPGAAREEVLDGVRVHRYRYAPAKWESLAYEGGIVQKLKAARLRWLLVPGFLLGQLLAIRRLHRRRPFDLIHAHWVVPQGLVAALARHLRFFRGPVVLTAHGGDLYSLDSGLFAGLRRWALAAADQVNVVSRSMLATCAELGVEEERLFVRSMGVSVGERFRCETPFEQRRGLVFVGRLVDNKGVEVLLRAFSRLCEEGLGAELTIVGGGPLLESLQAQARELGCASRVRFTGALPSAEIPAVLNRARIAVVPSVGREGLGLVAVEAQACGCAVVVSDLPALADVVEDGVTGATVPAGDSDALCRKLSTLMADPALARQLAENGLASSRRFAWRTVGEDFRARYLELLA